MLEIILVQGFCPLKIKIAHLNGFCPNMIHAWNIYRKRRSFKIYF